MNKCRNDLYTKTAFLINDDRREIKHFKEHGEDKIVTMVRTRHIIVDPVGDVFVRTNEVGYHTKLQKDVCKYQSHRTGCVMYVPMPKRNYAGVRY